jgi:hypothetical protein
LQLGQGFLKVRIGEIGMTGHTTGPHTHLEISKDGVKIDPLLVLPEIRKYPKEEDFTVIKSATPSAVVVPTFKPKLEATNSGLVLEDRADYSSGSAIQNQFPQSLPSETPAPTAKTQDLDNILTRVTSNPTPQTTLPQGGKIAILGFKF